MARCGERIGLGAAVVLVGLLGGCPDQILAPHVEPGGTIKVTLDGTMLEAVKGVAVATKEPFSVNATSPLLTVGFEAAGTRDGKSAFTVLVAANTSAVCDVGGANTSAIQVHAGGKSCVAKSGTMMLALGSDGNLGGFIDATGDYTAGGACMLHLELNGVPVDRSGESR